MEHPWNIFVGLICAVVFLASVYWQFALYYKMGLKPELDLGKPSFSPSQKKYLMLTVGVPFSGAIVLTLLAAVGAIGYGILANIDPERSATVNPTALLYFVLAVGAVSFAFVIKSFVNALILGATLTWTLYHLLSYGTFSFIPLFTSLFDLVASGAPDWIQVLYTIFALGYCGISCTFGTFDEALGRILD